MNDDDNDNDNDTTTTTTTTTTTNYNNETNNDTDIPREAAGRQSAGRSSPPRRPRPADWLNPLISDNYRDNVHRALIFTVLFVTAVRFFWLDYVRIICACFYYYVRI